jgi:D-erythro-7,8-dihydroneopterin triphosphate epimerase
MAAPDQPLDKIHIRDLCLRCIVGVNDDERQEKQDVVIHITLDADLRKAGQSDNIEDTINYRTVKRRIVALVEASSFYLIERLAEEIASICLEDPRIQQAKVTVEKPGALRFARTVAVEIVRTQLHHA